MATIEVVVDLTVCSKLVKGCLDSSFQSSRYYVIRLVWVSDHSGIAGNSKAD